MRELAALVDGPRKLRWFWREDLEGMQAAARRMGHPARPSGRDVPLLPPDRRVGRAPHRARRPGPRVALPATTGHTPVAATGPA